MKYKKAQYWQSVKNKTRTSVTTERAQEGEKYQGDVPVEDILASASSDSKAIGRRAFIKTLGFSTAAVSLAACNRAPMRKAVSFLNKPEEITPGIPTYYATYSPDGYSVLVKTVEGRPIKIEGNPECPISQGGVGVQGQAGVLNLYDNSQLRQPLLKDFDSSWEDIDKYIISGLKEATEEGKEIALISNTITGPSFKEVLDEFKAKYPTARHIVYDNVSYAGIRIANKKTFGLDVVPRYYFDKADVIVSFGADFLNTWLDGVAFSKQYAKRRSGASLEKMSKHIQFESIMSLTGSNADVRVPIKASEEGLLLSCLYAQLAKASGIEGSRISLPKKYKNVILAAARALMANKGSSLVVSGSNDPSLQMLVNNINHLLGNYSTTIDLTAPMLRYQGSDSDLMEFVSRANKGEVGAVIFMGVNPVYSFDKLLAFRKSLQSIPLKISISDRLDETADTCEVVALSPHYLSCWGDAEPYRGVYMLRQPTIAPIYNARQAEASLLKWSESTQSYASLLKEHWSKNILQEDWQLRSGLEKWQNALQMGFYTSSTNTTSGEPALLEPAILLDAVPGHPEAIELVLYESTAIRDGAGDQPNNPMLQELPDPLTKVTWDNYVSMSPQLAKRLSVEEEEMVKVSGKGYEVSLPVCLQPGQADNTVGIAVGYGRTHVGKVGNKIGENAYPFARIHNGVLLYTATVKLSKAGGIHHLAKTQTELSYHDRDIIRETTLRKFLIDPASGNVSHSNLELLSKKDENGKPMVNSQGRPVLNSMWDEHERKGLHWGMAIDLNLCTGCSACIVSCNLENNVAVVGPTEVRRRREMHWLRIDRYYSSSSRNSKNFIEGEDNVEVIHQPMLCQHCDHAPCETVCPVLATMHSAEGLNQMVYNRCFGTRYCANNCPYKVRRFNWFNYTDNDKFDYHMNNDLGKLVLNPEVTVRSRGVMEKCSMCVQRIQSAKLKAKLESRPLRDGDIETACSQSCPTNAITFGNVNDPESRVHKLLHSPRTYYVLEELNVQPGIGYLTMVRNKDN